MKSLSSGHEDAKLNELSASVAPNIFDVVLQADHIASLCIANLMSPALWDFRQKVRKGLEQQKPGSPYDLPDSIRAIQTHINKSFTHLHPTEVASVYGLLDLKEEQIRYPNGDIERIISELRRFFSSLTKTNSQLSSKWELILTWMDEGRFPNYYYSNFDLIRAHRKLSGQANKSPNGLTSCLDEVALFIALSLVIPNPSEIRATMVMSSVSHFGAFGYSEDGRRWWFNGKNQLYSKTDWDRRVENDGGDPQACFDQLFSNFNRISTVSGSADLVSGISDISEDHLKEYLDEMEAFFGVQLRQTKRLYSPTIKRHTEISPANFLRDLIGLSSREELLNRMHGREERWILRARYCFRSLDVADPRPYLSCARRNPLAKELAQDADSIDELVCLVKSLKGSTSIFNSIDRLAMPDETLRLDTGSHRDKGLLLHVLIAHFGQCHPLAQPVETLFCRTVTLVNTEGQWIDMSNFKTWGAPCPKEILFRL